MWYDEKCHGYEMVYFCIFLFWVGWVEVTSNSNKFPLRVCVAFIVVANIVMLDCRHELRVEGTYTERLFISFVNLGRLTVKSQTTSQGEMVGSYLGERERVCTSHLTTV